MIKCIHCENAKQDPYLSFFICLPCLERKKNQNFFDERKKKIHKCSLCKNIFKWDSESSWYGVLEDKNGNESVKKRFCSEKCRKLGIVKFKLPNEDFE